MDFRLNLELSLLFPPRRFNKNETCFPYSLGKDFYLDSHSSILCLSTVILDNFNIPGGRRGRDRMVVGFITTYTISAYHH